MQEVSIRDIRQGEEIRVSEFINGIFTQFVAPQFDKAGQTEFRSYIRASSIIERKRSSDYFLLVAETRDKVPELAGIIEVRGDHISLFFTAAAFQKKGVGKALLLEAIERSKKHGAIQLTVNSSPNAVRAYERLGFGKLDEEQIKNGMKFFPMKKTFPG
jgi:GNAT superfamily N-acetyltransferase